MIDPGRLIDENALSDMIAAQGGHDDGDEVDRWADDGGYVGVPAPRAEFKPTDYHGGYFFI